MKKVMLTDLLDAARRGEALWLPELRRLFTEAEGSARVILRLRLFGGELRDYVHFLPPWEGPEERELVFRYLEASVYNLLSVFSGEELCVYYDSRNLRLSQLISELPAAFAVGGYAKVLRIAGRLCRAFQRPPFSFAFRDLAEYSPLPARREKAGAPLAEALRQSCDRAQRKNLCGIDVGGTDIKLAAASGGRLLCVKEYDWNPAGSQRVEEILAPILLLARLMRACLAAELLDGSLVREEKLQAALKRGATQAEMADAVSEIERRYGERVRLLDGIGVSFPDIVIRDRIVGGETPKTQGLRANPALDYEREFARLGALKELLLPLCRPGGEVRLTNDGNMAAYTAAMELAHSPDARYVEDGVIAHTLGTDLGTGWLDRDGAIPPLPLEMYDLLLDVGNWPAAAYPPEDLRSTRNENSDLPGVRRYMGQAAAYRLAQELDGSLLTDFAVREGELLLIPTGPQDLRKPCLEHLMALADAGHPAAEEIFRRIGAHLAYVSREINFLLALKPRERFLFGRFVKSSRCFALLEEGFSRLEPGLRLVAADEELACTGLMRQLAGRDDVTVAQFGQAIGAIYFAITG